MGVLDVFSWEGLSVAPNDSFLAVEPTWTRLDNQGRLRRVSMIEIRRGRQDEFERTQTGTMTVRINDAAGFADPTSVDWISRPIAFAVRNPLTDTWHPRFRGSVDDHGYDLSPGRTKGEVVIEATDVLDYFANFELAPGLAGDTPPAQSAGYVFYEDTAVTGPQIRINQALADCDFPSGLASVFTGNVNLLETVYSPGESIEAVINDAADAEFPGVANRFVDKYGVFCFHGRLARFDPATIAASATHWDFNTWTVGGGGVEPRWPWHPSRSRRFIRNAAMCYPQGLAVADRPDQVLTDGTSITRHGLRSWSAVNLITKEGITSGLTGPEECLTYANYMIQNYADTQIRLDQLTIRPKRLNHPLAAQHWAMACEADISDQVSVSLGHPGGGGVSMTGFIEGITERWWPHHFDLDTGWPMFEITYDISPAAYWATEPELPA